MLRALRNALLRWDDRRQARRAYAAVAPEDRWDAQPKLTLDDLSRGSFAVAVFTAAWDGGWQHYRRTVRRMTEQFRDRVAVGFFDTDTASDLDADFLAKLGLSTAPAAGFFRDGVLVALHYGHHLDVPRMTECLLKGEAVPPLSVPPLRVGTNTY